MVGVVGGIFKQLAKFCHLLSESYQPVLVISFNYYKKMQVGCFDDCFRSTDWIPAINETIRYLKY